MVADSIAQMNKLIYGVSDLVKIKRENTMLLGDMNIYRLMTHAQQVEGDKLMKQSKENKKPRNGNYEYCQHKSDGGNPSRSQQKFSALAPSSASAPSSKNMYGQKGQGGNNGRTQSTTSAAPTSCPTQQGNSSGICGVSAIIYCMLFRLARIRKVRLRVFDLDVYALLDPGTTLSFVTPYIVVPFSVSPKTLSKPFSVSTQVRDSVLIRRYT
ncbi:uncharacterized protein [Solanum lycopersicum]|uniref:uncharacterized protein n=1 Tax=Solanum lycopersicum TaxID=4081 RepID=UPI00374A7B56